MRIICRCVLIGAHRCFELGKYNGFFSSKHLFYKSHHFDKSQNVRLIEQASQHLSSTVKCDVSLNCTVLCLTNTLKQGNEIKRAIKQD